MIELFKLAAAATAGGPAPPDFQHVVPMPDYLRNRTPGATYRTHPPLDKNLKKTEAAYLLPRDAAPARISAAVGTSLSLRQLK